MVGLTRERMADRHRRDLQQIATYAERMMQKHFPPMDFPKERWAYDGDVDEIVYMANWPSGNTIRVSGNSVRGLYSIRAMGPATEFKETGMPVAIWREEKNLDLLSVRCLAIEWTKHFT